MSLFFITMKNNLSMPNYATLIYDVQVTFTVSDWHIVSIFYLGLNFSGLIIAILLKSIKDF